MNKVLRMSLKWPCDVKKNEKWAEPTFTSKSSPIMNNI